MNTFEVIEKLQVGEVAHCDTYNITRSHDGELYFCFEDGIVQANFSNKGRIVLTQEFLSKSWYIIRRVTMEEAFKALLDGKKICKRIDQYHYYAQLNSESDGAVSGILEFSSSEWNECHWHICEE